MIHSSNQTLKKSFRVQEQEENKGNTENTDKKISNAL